MKLAEEWTDIKEEETGSMPPPLELQEILEQVRGFLSRYIVFSNEAQATAVTLWVAHTWVIDAFDYTPYLQISSPVKRCGKSRVFDCLKLLCAKPWVVVSITEAVMFRKIEKDTPTLLLDEIDAVFTPKKGDDGKEAIRALLNAGFERRATVPRCVGPNHTLAEFRVFCSKALAGIGKLPDTIADRSIPIIMARRKRGQHVEKFRARNAEVIAKPMAAALQAWASRQQTLTSLCNACPFVPDALGDRAADICEPLLAIAEMAGGEWPGRARSALVELCAGGDIADESIGIKLLAAIREIFEARKVDRISTKELLDALIERDSDEPWAVWWESAIAKGNVRGVAAKLARLLKPFDIIPETIREADGGTPKGYKLASFGDAFLRYLPENPP
ncbi:MAG: DUF3631 domain-containing protein [Terrimicrobiaceae bacterium]